MSKPSSVFRYRIRNWREYNRALINRGRLTVAYRGQHPRDEPQQLVQRVKCRGLPRHHVLDPARIVPLLDGGLRAELHDKGPLR